MVVSVDVGGVAVGAEHGPGSEARPPSAGAARGTRRDLLRGLLAPAAALAVTPLVAASGPVLRDEPPADLTFDEVYRGRHLRGGLAATADRALGGEAWQVTVDGRPLHLMRRADGGWLSMVDHYRSYPTPLDAARAAVDELGPVRQLREPGPAAAAHEGGHHGVHA
ncbi:tyrosinase family oxidase copper chaperone [Streptomyces sp. NPDC052676]|uniref:tyrosinase family oxidase copper chaperone n=1 Tax=Streptomyces sp. NPDC052676 TaxID=3154953 RepID=UPI00344A4B9C